MPDTTRFRSLESIADLPVMAEGPSRICIVTPDLLGPVKNGGIGTACGYLAYALAEAGHSVNLLFCQTGAESLDPGWIAAYEARGIGAVNAAAWQKELGEAGNFPGLGQLAMSRTVYEWLKTQPDFDLVLFMDWQGAGFYALHARACGAAFERAAMVVVIHSPSYWHSIHNAAVASSPLESLLWHMERKAIGMADAVISPSRYMLGWTEERLCPLPARAIAQANLLEWGENLRHDSDDPIREVVFFGRLEFRKGLEQFCGALDRLAAKGELPPVITFLGKCSWMGDEHSAFYLARRSRKWTGAEIRLLTQKDHREAVEYICGPGRLAVMPSIADNSPYTVYECLAAGVPFLARNVGGISEFLPGAEADVFLFGDNPAELAERIAKALGKPPRRGTLAIDFAANARAWRLGLPKLARLIQNERSGVVGPQPAISIILTHYNRPELLRQSLNSLLDQDYQDFELILADDGSTSPEAIAMLESLAPLFAERGWTILRLANGHAAAARNRGAAVAKGDWLLFFDDDNVALPQMLGACAKAAKWRQNGFVALMFRVFEGMEPPCEANAAEVFLPTADAIAYGSLVNTLSDTTALVHKKDFESVGGFREDYGVGHEDFELFLRLALAGIPGGILPEPLFWYRRSQGKASVQLNTNAALNRMRSLRPFLEMLPPHLAELALMTHGMGQMLNMFPDPNAELFRDMPLDRRSDPDCGQTMIDAANILASQGYGQLATQILESLPENERPAMGGLIRARAIAASRQGDLAKIRACMKEFAQLGLADLETSRLYQVILDNLAMPAKNLRAQLIRLLRKLPNALACLLLAQEAAGEGDLAAAAEEVLNALKYAERSYLTEERPDVAKAVESKSFICGLQHFALHGATDKTPWPERATFSHLLKQYPELLPLVLPKHMSIWKYEDARQAKLMLASLLSNYADEFAQGNDLNEQPRSRL